MIHNFIDAVRRNPKSNRPPFIAFLAFWLFLLWALSPILVILCD